jgi:hypothetical protein
MKVTRMTIDPKLGLIELGVIEMPGGWRVPAGQAPEPFPVEEVPAFPPVPRGGIKYPDGPVPTTKEEDNDN